MNDFRNIHQATYNRLLGHVAARTQPAAIDVRDLLRAYEDAITILDNLINTNHDLHGSEQLQDAEEFLYLASGDPRVELLDEPV